MSYHIILYEIKTFLYNIKYIDYIMSIMYYLIYYSIIHMCTYCIVYIYMLCLDVLYICVYHICKYSKYVYNHIIFYLYDLYDI